MQKRTRWILLFLAVFLLSSNVTIYAGPLDSLNKLPLNEFFPETIDDTYKLKEINEDRLDPEKWKLKNLYDGLIDHKRGIYEPRELKRRSKWVEIDHTLTIAVWNFDDPASASNFVEKKSANKGDTQIFYIKEQPAISITDFYEGDFPTTVDVWLYDRLDNQVIELHLHRIMEGLPLSADESLAKSKSTYKKFLDQAIREANNRVRR